MTDCLEKTASRHSGFTLVELMIILAVASILVTVGIPSYMNMTASNRVTTASNNLVMALNLARSEAVRSSTNSILCKINAAGNGCDNASTWDQGWFLYSDTNGDDAFDAADRIIRVQSALTPDLNFNFFTGNFIRFTPSGRTNQNGRFCFENSYDGDNSRAVIITQAGRFRTEKRKASNNCAP